MGASDEIASPPVQAATTLRLDPVNHPMENPIPQISDHLVDSLGSMESVIEDQDTALMDESSEGSGAKTLSSIEQNNGKLNE